MRLINHDAKSQVNDKKSPTRKSLRLHFELSVNSLSLKHSVGSSEEFSSGDNTESFFCFETGVKKMDKYIGLSLVHVQNWGGGGGGWWQAVSLGGGVTVMEKWEILVGWVTKVRLKCTKKLG